MGEPSSLQQKSKLFTLNLSSKSHQQTAQITCDLCKVTVNSESALLTHLSGKKHKRLAERQKEFQEQCQASIYVKGFRCMRRKEAILKCKQELTEYFSKFGEVKQATIQARIANHPYALIAFQDAATARKVVESTEAGHAFHDRKLVVRPRTWRPPSERKQREKRIFFPPRILQDKLQQDERVESVDDQIHFVRRILALPPPHRNLRDKQRCFYERKFQEIFPSASIHLFGSSVNGFGVKGCDMDVFLSIPGLESRKERNKNEEPMEVSTDDVVNGTVDLQALTTSETIALVGDVIQERILASSGHVTKIPGARCPLVKFFDKYLNLTVDISVNNNLATYNTQLQKLYCNLDERVRPMVYAIRQWAISKNLQPHLTSYAVTLLVIFYLQQLSPRVIPTVRELRELPGTTPVTVYGWDCSFTSDPEKVPKIEPFNKSSLAELLVGFFKYYDSEFDFATQVVSPLEGRPILITEIVNSVKTDYGKDFKVGSLCVQDPFELDHNVAAALDSSRGALLMDLLQDAVAVCDSPEFFEVKKGEKWGFTLLIEPEDDDADGEEEPEAAVGSGEADGAQGGVAPGGEAATTHIANLPGVRMGELRPISTIGSNNREGEKSNKSVMDAMTTSLEFSMTMRKENTPRGFLSQMPHPKAARENWCKNNAVFIYKSLKEGLLLDCHILQTSVPELMDLATTGEDAGAGDVGENHGSIDINDGAVSGSDAKDIVRRVESEILTLGKHKMTATETKTEAALDCAAAAAKRLKIESTASPQQPQHPSQQQAQPEPSTTSPKPPPPPLGMGRSGIVLLHMRCSTKIKVWQNRKASVKLLDLTSQGGLMKYMNLEREKRISEEVKRQAETNAFLRCGEVFWVTVEDNPDPRHATVVLRFTFFLQKKRDYVMFYDFLEHYIPKVVECIWMKTYPKVKRVESGGVASAEEIKAEKEEEEKSERMVAQVFDDPLEAGADQSSA